MIAYPLAVFDNKLIAGGLFTAAGEVSANKIAAWNGFSWSPLGMGTDGVVSNLTVYDNRLIASGGFSHAGGIDCSRIAQWNPCPDADDDGVCDPPTTAPLSTTPIRLILTETGLAMSVTTAQLSITQANG